MRAAVRAGDVHTERVTALLVAALEGQANNVASLLMHSARSFPVRSLCFVYYPPMALHGCDTSDQS